ncbi:hypothetical protein ACOME3_006528 [Neoechinorhynchus agilis]
MRKNESDSEIIFKDAFKQQSLNSRRISLPQFLEQEQHKSNVGRKKSIIKSSLDEALKKLRFKSNVDGRSRPLFSTNNPFAVKKELSNRYLDVTEPLNNKGNCVNFVIHRSKSGLGSHYYLYRSDDLDKKDPLLLATRYAVSGAIKICISENSHDSLMEFDTKYVSRNY